MISKTEILQFIRERKVFLQEQYGVTNISLFGSFARGEEKLRRKVDVPRKHPHMKQRLIEEINKDAVYV